MCRSNRDPRSRATKGQDAASREAIHLMKALEKDDRFRRDSRLGAIFHWGKASFREVSPTDSLHIIFDGAHVSAHVDDVAPLAVRPDGTIRYAWGRVLAHNVAGIATDVGRRVRGHHGQHRCRLHCETVWVEDGDVRCG